MGKIQRTHDNNNNLCYISADGALHNEQFTPISWFSRCHLMPTWMVFVIDLTWPFSSHICCFITFMADVLCVVDFQAGSFPSGDRPAPPQPEQRKEKTLSSNGSCCSSLPPPLALGHGRYGLFTLSHHIKKIKIALTSLVCCSWTDSTYFCFCEGEAAWVENAADQWAEKTHYCRAHSSSSWVSAC